MEIFFIHNEWNDICILKNNNIISRKNIQTEKGYYYYDKNDILVIKWDNWSDKNIFKKN